MDLLNALKKKLVVSCQAAEGSPMDTPAVIAAIAETVVSSGAAGVRINGPTKLAAVRARVAVPIVGLWKLDRPDSPVYITPTLEAALAVAEAGADVIALDATLRRRPGGVDLAGLVRQIRQRTNKPLMADVATYDEGVNAARLGFDLVGTTLAGYTAASAASPKDAPDLELLGRLARDLDVPVVGEGRFNTPELVRAALDLGAHFVCVGSAITAPGWITARFVQT